MHRDDGPAAPTEETGPGAGDPPKSVFFIKPKENSLKGVETFLRNRQWKLDTAFELRDALSDILKAKPGYVFVCIDHPNAKAKIFPKLIQQASSAKVILYAEADSKLLASVAAEGAFQYVLYPPISGPAVERMILKVQRDEKRALEGPDEDDGTNPQRKSSLDSDDGRISVQGGSGSERAMKVSGSSGGGSENARIQSFGENDEEDSSAIQGSRRGSESDDENSAARKSNSFLAIQKSEQNRYSAMQEGVDPLTGSNAAASGAELGEEPSAEAGALLESAGDSALNDPPESEARIRIGGDAGPPEESTFIRGSAAALQRAVTAGGESSTPVKTLDAVARVGCIEVQTPSFDGYLLAAWAYDRRVDAEMLKTLKVKLTEFMADSGESIEATDLQSLELRDVTFEGWARKQAAFLRKAVHQNHEIAIAFFPKLVDEPEIDLSEGHVEMAKMSLDEIKGDEKVEFGVYLHMKANQKFFLYARSGGRLYDSQKERLKAKGVDFVHLRKDALVDLRRYRIQNYLNAKIAALSDD